MQRYLCEVVNSDGLKPISARGANFLRMFYPSKIGKRLFNLTFFFAVCTLVLIALIALYHTAIVALTLGLSSAFDQTIPTVALISGLGVFNLSNPVHCLIALILVFLVVVSFFLTLGAEFLALVFLIVYVGAIAILFLFVIMLLNVKELANALRLLLAASQRAAQILGVPFSLTLIFVTSFLLGNLFVNGGLFNAELVTAATAQINSFVGRVFQDVMIFSELLYTYYSSLFMQITLLLLTAMLGSIILATAATDKPNALVSSSHPFLSLIY
jgi:NADH-quinone oxidoreductase subunit J